MSHRCVAQHLPGRHLPEDLFAFSLREAALLLAQSLPIARAWGDGVVINPDDILLLIATCHKLYHGAPSLSQLVELMAATKSAGPEGLGLPWAAAAKQEGASGRCCR